MLGFHNFTIALVYILCNASTVICVAWGAINWNRGGENPVEPTKIFKWEKEEEELEENL